jgi:hypothetical protein
MFGTRTFPLQQTGPVPNGADAVVMVEYTSPVHDDNDDDNQNRKRVAITKGVAKGQDIRPVVCERLSLEKSSIERRSTVG